MPKATVWELLTELGKKGATGILFVKTGTVEKRVFFKLGFLRQIDSNPPDPREMLGILLRSQGRLTDDDIKKSLQLMKEKNIFQGEALLMLGKIKLDELDALLTWQQNVKLYNLLSIKEFTHEFKQLPTDKIPKGYNINLFGSIFQFLKKTITMDEVKQYIDDNFQSFLIPVSPPPINPDECFMKKDDKKFYEIISIASPPMRIIQMFERSPFPRSETYVTLFSMSKMGFFNIQEKIETAEFDERKYRDLLKEFTETMDNFQIIGVHWSCCYDEINVAYEKRKKEFRIREGDTPEVSQMKKEILAQVDKAYNFLKEEKNRIDYRKKILDKFKVDTGAQVLFEKGEISLELRGNFKESYELFGSAHDLIPQNADYAAAFGFVKFKIYKGTDIDKSRNGEEILEQALQKGQKSFYTHYFKARLFEEKGLTGPAIQELRIAMNLNPSKSTARDMMRRLTKGSA